MPLRTPLARFLVELCSRTLQNESPRPISRRQFLREASALATTVALAAGGVSSAHASKANAKLRIAIVGAGAAGLTAAYYLERHGFRSTIFESSDRLGGRIFTARDLFHHDASGSWTELGGEFIDSTHVALLSLARELGMTHMIDRKREERSLIEHTFFIEGRIRNGDEILRAFRPVLPKLTQDIASLPANPNYRNANDAARRLDAISLYDYLQSLDAEPWFATLLNVAYLNEYGLDTRKQSSLNLLTMLETTADRFRIYGASDERFKLVGGNDRLILALEKRLKSSVHRRHALTKLEKSGSEYVLSLNGETSTFKADVVILTLPFTKLREVELAIPMSEAKRLAIAELGYGKPVKLILDMKTPVWRDSGRSGYTITDAPWQAGWDSSEGQHTGRATYTMFIGDREQELQQSPESLASTYLPALEAIYTGATSAYDNKAVKFDWTQYPHTKGGYACYRVGQWTAFGGAEAEPEERVLFAGEHCSREFQGFINGAVETGRKVAQRVIELR